MENYMGPAYIYPSVRMQEKMFSSIHIDGHILIHYFSSTHYMDRGKYGFIYFSIRAYGPRLYGFMDFLSIHEDISVLIHHTLKLMQMNNNTFLHYSYST